MTETFDFPHIITTLGIMRVYYQPQDSDIPDCRKLMLHSDGSMEWQDEYGDWIRLCDGPETADEIREWNLWVAWMIEQGILKYDRGTWLEDVYCCHF